jgi:DNA-binding NtrC family response regulator
MDAKASILVVDDEEIVRRSYARILDEMTATRRRLRTARRRCTRWSSGRSMVLLDIRMPGAQGLTLKEIKHRWLASEVVIITGYPTVESAEALQLGACDYRAFHGTR